MAQTIGRRRVLRDVLMISTSLAALTASGPTEADCLPSPFDSNSTITCSGDTTGSIIFNDLATNVDVTVTEGSSLEGDDLTTIDPPAIGFLLGATEITITNLGTIEAPNAIQFFDEDGGATLRNIRIVNGSASNTEALILVDGSSADFGGSAIRLEDDSEDTSNNTGNVIENYGTIRVQNWDSADGIATDNLTEFTFINHASGSIEFVDVGFLDGFELFDTTGSIRNDGSITTTGSSFATAIDVSNEAFNTFSITNTGTIEGFDQGIRIRTEVFAGADLPTNGTITNSGTISSLGAGIDLLSLDPFGEGSFTVNDRTVFRVNNLAGGVIEGDDYGIWSSASRDVIVNAGLIAGGDSFAVNLDDGNDLLRLESGGDFVGTLFGGDGIDILELMGGATLDGDIPVFEFEQIRKSGSGTATIADLSQIDFSDSTGTTSFRVLDGALVLQEGSTDPDIVSVSSGAMLDLQPGASLFADSFSLASGGTLNLEPDANVFSDAYSLSGNVINNGSLITFGPMRFLAGSTVSGNGVFDAIEGGIIDFAGTLSPGNSIGTTEFIGDTIFRSGSRLIAEVSSTPGVSDQFIVTDGSLTIQDGAILQIIPIGNLSDFQRGATYQIVSAENGIFGDFTVFEGVVFDLESKIDFTIDGNTIRGIISRPSIEEILLGLPTDYTIEHTGYNPVNGNPASLLPSMASDDFLVGTAGIAAAGGVTAGGVESRRSTFGVGIEAGSYNTERADLQRYSAPANYTYPLADRRWALILDSPVSVLDVEGGRAYSVTPGIGLRMPIFTDNWTITPIVRTGFVHSDDFNTGAVGFGASVTNHLVFDLGDGWSASFGNLIGYYRAEDSDFIMEDGLAYETENTTLKNGISVSAPIELFGEPFLGTVFATDMRHWGSDLFVQNSQEIGILVTERGAVYGTERIRFGIKYTHAEDWNGVSLNFDYRF